MSNKPKEQPLSEIAKAMIENMKANAADPEFDRNRDERMRAAADEALRNAGLHPDQIGATEEEAVGSAPEDFKARQARRRAEREREFAALRDEAARVKRNSAGKEPFTVAGLERELVQLGETTEGRSQRELEAIEINYYLAHRSMTTLAELAQAVAGT